MIQSRIVFIAVVLGGCAGTPRIGDMSFEGERVIVPLETGCGEEDSDSISVFGAELRDELLVVDVAHGGGCEEHTYRVCGAREVLRTEPGQWVITVLHDANGDQCDAEHFRALEVDISRRNPVGLSNLDGRSFTVLVR